MRVGWLADQVASIGGAELTQAEFRAAAPKGVEIHDCPPGKVKPNCHAYVVHNCVSYSAADMERLGGNPIVKYWHDVGPHVDPVVRQFLDEFAAYVFCSPLQAEAMGFTDQAHLIPPPIDLRPFILAGAEANGSRSGAVSVAAWGNPGTAPGKAAEWGAKHGGVDFYGGGAAAPPGSREVHPEAMPLLLSRYERFVFLPTALEPFGRVVAEAWAAGLELVVNGNVGATYWLENEPERIETAAADFWKLVMA